MNAEDLDLWVFGPRWLHCSVNSPDDADAADSDHDDDGMLPVTMGDNDEDTDNDNYDYELSRGTPVNKFSINLGTNELPRFSCACHK